MLADAGAIRIEPVDPDMIYVPQYDPNLVYVTACPISFGIGFPIGLWCDDDFDWNHRYIVIGGGWYNGWRHPVEWDQHPPAWNRHPAGWVPAPQALGARLACGPHPAHAHRRHPSGPRSAAWGTAVNPAPPAPARSAHCRHRCRLESKPRPHPRKMGNNILDTQTTQA